MKATIIICAYLLIAFVVMLDYYRADSTHEAIKKHEDPMFPDSVNKALAVGALMVIGLFWPYTLTELFIMRLIKRFRK